MNFQPFTLPSRTLLGPGPSEVPPSVLEAMSRPLVGHLDPSFIGMMEEIKSMLRKVFLTDNEIIFPVSGTGSAGMEFCFANLIEPGDEVIIPEPFYANYNGFAITCGLTVVPVTAKIDLGFPKIQ